MLCAGAYGTAVALGVGRLDVDIANATPTWAIDLVLAAPSSARSFILGEEIGWRGYLLPRMQQLTSKRRAAVLTGFVHGCFHLPLILLATTYNTEGSRWVAAPVAVAVITAGGVFYAWIWDSAKTVWPVAIAHNTVNTVFALGSTAVVATGGTTVAYVAGETGFATLAVCVIAAVVLLRKARVWREPAVAGRRRHSEPRRRSGCVVSGHEGAAGLGRGVTAPVAVPRSRHRDRGRGAALASLLTTDPGSIDSRLEDPDIVSAVATVAAAGALAWRRSRPAASYAVMVVGSLVVSLTGHYIGLLSVLMLFSLYSLAAHGRRRDGLIGLGVGVLCFVGLALLDVPDLGTSVLLQSLALLVAAWALGDAIRSRRQAPAEQVARRGHRGAAADRPRAARRGGAQHVADRGAGRGGRARDPHRLDAAEQSPRGHRRHQPQGARADPVDARAAARGGPRTGTRPPTQGSTTSSRWSTTYAPPASRSSWSAPGRSPSSTPPSRSRSTALVQESLTNVIKHSAAATASVDLRPPTTALDIEVTDPGPARDRAHGRGSGHGLVGLAERVRPGRRHR